MVKSDFNPDDLQHAYRLYRAPQDAQGTHSAVIPTIGGENAGYITPIRGMHIGIRLRSGYTSDHNYIGRVVRVRNGDGTDEGLFLPRDAGGLLRLFRPSRHYLAERALDRALFNPDSFFIPERDCIELEIEAGEQLHLSRDPSVKPTENLLEDALAVILQERRQPQMQDQSGAGGIFPPR